MASSRPGESNGRTTGSVFPSDRNFRPLSDDTVSFIRDYDVPAAAAYLSSLRHCSLEEQIETFKKNLESSRKPNAAKQVGEEDEDEEYDDEMVDVDDDEDDEVDEAEEDEKGGGQEVLKLMMVDGQHQVPNEGERECKKPRLAEGFGCQGEA